MNRLILVGRIVRDIELKVVGTNDDVVLNNVIAVPRHLGGEDQTDFIPFVAWNQRAELIESYCHKGDMIALDGRVQIRRYKNAEGNTCHITEMIVEHIQLLPNKKPS